MSCTSIGLRNALTLGAFLVALTSWPFDRLLAQDPCSLWSTGQQEVQDDVQAFYGSQNCGGELLLNVVVVARGTPHWFTHSFDAADLGKYQPGGEVYETVKEWREEFEREIRAQGGHPGGVLFPDLLWGIGWFVSDQRLRLMYGNDPPEYTILDELDVPSPKKGALVVVVDNVDGSPELVGTFVHDRISVEGIDLTREQVTRVRSTGQLPADFDPAAALRAVISTDSLGAGLLRR
jgi:hypothetical protein